MLLTAAEGEGTGTGNCLRPPPLGSATGIYIHRQSEIQRLTSATVRAVGVVILWSVKVGSYPTTNVNTAIQHNLISPRGIEKTPIVPTCR